MADDKKDFSLRQAWVSRVTDADEISDDQLDALHVTVAAWTDKDMMEVMARAIPRIPDDGLAKLLADAGDWTLSTQIESLRATHQKLCDMIRAEQARRANG